MIEIDGVPPDVSPLLIQAIKDQKKLLNQIIKYRKQQQQQQSISTLPVIYNAATTTSNNNNSHEIGKENNNDDTKDNVLDRMEYQKQRDYQQSIIDAIPNEIKEQSKVVSKSMDTLLTRLNAEEKKNRTRKIQSKFNDDDEEEQNKSITVSCLIFILDLILETEDQSKMVLCLAAITVGSNIIYQTNNIKLCTTCLVSTYPVKKVIDFISCNKRKNQNIHEGQNELLTNNHDSTWIKNQILMEIWKIFTHIKARNRDKSYYPKIIVTLRYLEEQKGVIGVIHKNSESTPHIEIMMHFLSSPSVTNPHSNHHNLAMVEKRRIRDIALKYGEREIKRVEKILKCIDKCIEIIVPRFASNNGMDNDNAKIDVHIPSNKTESEINTEIISKKDVNVNNNSDIDSNGDDEDDVDWEDGDDEELIIFDEAEATIPNDRESAEKDQHIAAVERSIELIKETGTLNQEGKLHVNVDFSSSSFLELTESHDNYLYNDGSNKIKENDDNRIQLARQKLDKCINLLSNRHKPRLDVWVDALISADNMTAITYKDNEHDVRGNQRGIDHGTATSVVLLPLVKRQQKGYLSRILSDFKTKVVMTLALASKLGIPDDNEDVSTKNNDVAETQQNEVVTSATNPQIEIDKESNFIPWQLALGIHQNRVNKEIVSSSNTKKRKNGGTRKRRLQIKLRKS